MVATFDRELLKILKENGCVHVRDGRHPIYYSPISKLTFPVPNGIKSRHTANEVLKQAGLPKAF
jgi:predicted RNA binding protein YcfA (HicA-like mRNA interferase family)